MDLAPAGSGADSVGSRTGAGSGADSVRSRNGLETIGEMPAALAEISCVSAKLDTSFQHPGLTLLTS